MKRAAKPRSPIVSVEVLEAKPNKMFSEVQRRTVRFLRYNQTMPCAECGKKRRVLWTLLLSFEAHTMAALVPIKSGKVHLPLTGVCTSHILAIPFWEAVTLETGGRV